MKNDFFKISSKRILFSTVMASALLAGSPQTAFADAMEVQTVMQAGTVKGQIVDANGEPVIGASVQVKGSNTGIISDIDGNFTISAPSNGTLVISYVGYRTQNVKLNGKNSIKVTMQEDAELLDEIVVVGYGTQKKASLTSAITQVRGDEVIKDRTTTNATLALQGAVPGLTITRTSTRPGSEDISMKIRGNISVNDLNDKGKDTSSPLVLIDGMTSSLDELNAMEPNDIENISVLKDASAAIYGSRSSYGVVLVTTKRGKKGKALISYSGSFSTTIDGIKQPMTNTQQWLDMFYEAQYNDMAARNPELVGKVGSDGVHSALEDIPGAGGFWWIFDNIWIGTNVENGEYYKGRKTWEALRNGQSFTLNNGGVIGRYVPNSYIMDELYGSAFSHKHNLNISGADDKFAYRASVGYADNNSQLKVAEDGEKKYSARLNMDYQATSMLKLETGMSFEKRTITTPTTDVNAGWYDPWFWPFYNEAGQVYDTFGNRNPVGGLVNGGQAKNQFTTYRANAKATFDFSKWVEGLSISASGAYKLADRNLQSTFTAIKYYDWEGNMTYSNRNNPASMVEEYFRTENYNIGAFANYERRFGEHNVSAMLGVTAEEENYKHVKAARRKGEIFEGSGLTDLNIFNGGDNNTAEGGRNSWALLSYITRLGYSYKDRYLVEFLGRRDGSSKLTPEQRWENFYSVSGGWVISEESFMKGIDWLDFLKIRYNYGKTGSVTGIGNYESYAAIKTGEMAFGTDMKTQTTMLINGMTSTQRTWETLKSHNIGLDFTVLNNRLSTTVEWFQKTNEGMFIPITYPSVLGAGAPKTNNGRFRSKGWELSLNWRDRIGQVSYNIGANLSDAKSEVLELKNNENVPNAGINNGRLVGDPLSSIYVYRTDGIFQTQDEVNAYYEKYYWNADHSGPKSGNIIPAPQEKATNTLRPGARKLVDNDGDGAITTKDLWYAGDTAPHFMFGVNAGLEWKGIDFTVFFQGVGKQNVLRSGYFYAPWISNYTNQNSIFIGKTWTEENPNTEYTIMSRDVPFNKWNYENKDVSVQNSRYVRLKSLVVGYTLPKAWTQKASLSKVRLYFSGEDLWEWSSIKDGYDPEFGEGSNSTFPFSRLLSFGVDITF